VLDTCAIVTGGSVRCWGYNGDGELGNGRTRRISGPVTVRGLTGATAVSAGWHQTCAVLSGGTAECWGYNGNGELGNGSTNNSTVPTSVGALVAARGPAFKPPAKASGRKVFFFANPGGLPRFPHQLVMRPSSLALFQDGSWVLTGLRWRGWGSRVAHATGTSDASNGMPDQADGARLRTPAKLTLSNPGRFAGRQVYRCFRLTVRPPATSSHGCLSRSNGLLLLNGWP
jgi:alpha-tubulin suppressor-like RCC1 family protein